MALTNAERQRRWREAHKQQRRAIDAAAARIVELEARIAALEATEITHKEAKGWPAVRLMHEVPDNSGFETDEEFHAALLLQWLEDLGRSNENTRNWREHRASVIVILIKFAAAIEHFGPELAKAIRRLAAHIESRPVPKQSRSC